MIQNEVDLSELRDALPEIVPHCRIDELLGGIISRGYLANLNSEGKGPERFRIGRKTCYKRDILVSWLEGRAQKIDE